jgi:septal ring factor EnvC (AmiA/AmiB activator)
MWLNPNKPMKKLLTIVFVLSLASTGMAWPWNKKEAVKPEVKKPAVVKVESGTTIQQAKQVIKELNSELQSAKVENTKLKTNLANANKKVADAETNLSTVQKQADLLKEWGIQKQNEAFQWLEKYTKAVKRYHRLKMIAAVVAGLFGAMLGMWAMRFVPPIYAAYAMALPIAGAGIAAGALWMFL